MIGSLAACHQRGISSHAVAASTAEADTVRARQEAFDSLWAPMYRRQANNNAGILMDLADSTLLFYGIGGYDEQGGKYFVYLGTRHQGRDSIKIEVVKRFGDSLTQVIYMRGLTDWHDIGASYDECGLILHKMNGYWQVQDVYRLEDRPDDGEVSMLGTYARNYFLMKNRISYEGHPYAGINDVFYMISRDSFDCCELSLNRRRENFAMSYVVYQSDRDTCNIYDVRSIIDFHYDAMLDCIVLDYAIHKIYSGSPACAETGPIDTTYHQTWYMNEDTILMGRGDLIEFTECIATDRVNLSDSTLRALLRKPDRPQRGFKMYPGVSGRIEEDFHDN